MTVIAQTAVGVHFVRVIAPDGSTHDVLKCGLRRALRVGAALAGWFGVDDWESASAFTPRGVERVRRALLREKPGIEFTRCTVEVVVPAEGPDAVNGYEAVRTYPPGKTVPEIVKKIRDEAKEAGWREDPAERNRGPHFIVGGDPDDDPDDTATVPRDVNYTASDDDPLTPNQ